MGSRIVDTGILVGPKADKKEIQSKRISVPGCTGIVTMAKMYV